MTTNNDGINTDLRAHPDVFIPRDGIFDDNDKSNYINDDTRTRTRTRSNSGSIFESATGIISGHQQPAMSMMSQSYGGDRASSFLLRQGNLSPASRRYR
jgi:hypothetical protein